MLSILVKTFCNKALSFIHDEFSSRGDYEILCDIIFITVIYVGWMRSVNMTTTINLTEVK